MWQLPLPQDWSSTTVSLAADTDNAALYVAALGDRYEIISHRSDELAAAVVRAPLLSVLHGAYQLYSSDVQDLQSP